MESFWLRHKTLQTLFFSSLSKNKFEQACRKKAKVNSNFDNIYVSRTSLVTNSFTKFASLAGLNHVHAVHEPDCFDTDLTWGRWCRSFYRKRLFFRLINKRLWILFLILESFWLHHKNSENLLFLSFGWPDRSLVKTLLKWPAS